MWGIGGDVPNLNRRLARGRGRRTRCLLLGALALLLSACGAAKTHYGPVNTGPSFIDFSRGKELDQVGLDPKACEGVDLSPEHGHLDDSSFGNFLTQQQIRHATARARPDLVFYDIALGDGRQVRFRVATLGNRHAASRDLHDAIVQHGAGAWGVHRGNLAVLAPGGKPEDVLRFAAQSKLSCWGMLTYGVKEDVITVRGNYLEL